MTDQNRKTLRSFYCRDYLWELFEHMTHEMGCSMDYLVNESMRMYARSRDFSVDPAQGQAAPPSNGYQNPDLRSLSPPQVPASSPFGTGAPPAPPRPPVPVDRFNVGHQGGAFEHRTLERMPAVNASRPAPPQAPGGNYPPSAPSGPPPPPPRPHSNSWQQQAPAPQQGGFNTPSIAAGRQSLYLTFHNNRYTIDKDKFVIGRGSQQTDLTIRDGNISRKHCAVIYHNGIYYIRDLGSTNGIDYQGTRIESQEIREGDVFSLCDYELRFSYR